MLDPSSLNALPDFVAGGRSYIGVSAEWAIEQGVEPAAMLDGVKAALRSRIDLRAEDLRQRLITGGSGQAMEYQEARTQAAAALKAPSSATSEKYPMLAASIGIDIDPETGGLATDVLGVARSVDAAFKLWLGYGASIRAARLAAKAEIDRAATVEAAIAVFDAVPWPAS